MRKKYLLGIGAIALLFILYMVVQNGSIGVDIAKAYSEQDLYQDAIELANADSRVVTAIGKIDALDVMAILEGNVQYTGEGTKVASTVRVKGSKTKAKMDIWASRQNQKWIYDSIRIRYKDAVREQRMIRLQ
ncbi:MAG: cytochrome c oxidase assembly factor Coa1 family protein [Flavobacteriaceae bacterium]|nr:cytochrome c oxidase assembly factor Coa1 family protein [Flavobacteriaceae bacterium]